MNLVDVLFLISGVFSTIFLLVSFTNFLYFPQLNLKKSSGSKKVNILIPLRNEEHNASEIIESCFQQSYINKNVTVINDNSTDNTEAILKELKIKYPELNVLTGEELPNGWSGKNYACHQLSKNVDGEYILFIDADVRLNPKALESAVARIEESNVGLLTIFSTQKTFTFGERLTVPIINYVLLTLLPLFLSNKLKIQSLSAANGQFMLFNTKTYSAIDGHQSVKNEIVEDVKLSQLIKSKGYKTLTLLGGDLVTCRMYTNFYSGFNGLVKILNRILFGSITSFIFAGIFLITYILPFALLSFKSEFILVLINNLLSALFVMTLSRKNLLNLLLLPFNYAILFITTIVSIYKYNTSGIVWKDRTIKQ